MTVYFYHTQDLNYIYREWEAGRFPGHLLYGATHLPDEGIGVVMHKHSKADGSRLVSALRNAAKVIFCKEKFDAVYATKYNGLELLIFLRALGLYHKPIILWHHQPVVVSKGWLKNMVSRLFYKGIDHMFFSVTGFLRCLWQRERSQGTRRSNAHGVLTLLITTGLWQHIHAKERTLSPQERNAVTCRHCLLPLRNAVTNILT